MANDDTLTLSNLTPERPTANLAWEKPDGELVELQVELAVREDFGVMEHAELERARMQYEILKAKGDDATPAEKGRAEELLNKLARRLIIGGPDEAIPALHAGHKDTVVQRFFSRSDAALLKTLQGLDERTLNELARLGNSSLDSSGSMAATQSSGGE